MKRLSLIFAATISLSLTAAAQAQDGKIVHSFATDGPGAFGIPFAEGSDRVELDRAYRSGGAEAVLPLAMKQAHDGSATAMRFLGLLYARGEGVQRDDDVAMTWFRKAAARGDATAMYAIGLAYWRGAGVARDPNVARHWLIAAADRGEPRARPALSRLSRLLD
jgi:TPR repeat protein